MIFRTRFSRGALIGLVVLAVGGGILAVNAQGQSADEAYAEMEQLMGQVPAFIRAFPKGSVAGAWEELKTLQFSSDTAIPPKYKELIGLAVAAQIPCDYCVYGHTAAARANGASEQEIQEAVAMAALTRHWSTVLNGTQADMRTFRADFDAILAHAAAQASEATP